jgi:hypothetical protein
MPHRRLQQPLYQEALQDSSQGRQSRPGDVTQTGTPLERAKDKARRSGDSIRRRQRQLYRRPMSAILQAGRGTWPTRIKAENILLLCFIPRQGSLFNSAFFYLLVFSSSSYSPRLAFPLRYLPVSSLFGDSLLNISSLPSSNSLFQVSTLSH